MKTLINKMHKDNKTKQDNATYPQSYEIKKDACMK